MKDDNDWMSENEEIEMKRKAYNDLLNNINNLSPAELKWLKVGTALVFAAAIILIVAVFLRITVEVLSGVFN